MSVVPGERWNHNIHYHRLTLATVPRDARAAVDLGCGEGMLCRALQQRVGSVVGIDLDADGIALARSAGGDIDYVHGDFLTHDLAPGSFDLVASVATLHHVDPARALQRMRELLRPGGVLVVVGIPRRSLTDLPYDAVGFFAHRLLKARRGYWEHPSPIVEPSLTYRQVRHVIQTELPGARCRRHALFRYSAIWHKPLVAGTT